MRLRARQARRRLHGPLLILALFLAGGCSIIDHSTRTGAPSGPDVARLARLETIRAWRVEGRAVVHAGHRAGQLGFDWCRGASGDVITFTDPFGRALARLSGRPGRIVLERPGRPPRVAREGESLLVDAFGWTLPLADLPAWLMGRAGTGEITWDALGRPTHWSVGGWRLDYLDYGRWNDIDLPRLLEARREDRSIRLRLVIEGWSPGRACGENRMSSTFK